MQMRAPRSKPLTRVFGRTRARADVRGERCAAAATCARAITRGRVVPGDVAGEANHVVHSTRVGAGQLKREIGRVRCSLGAQSFGPRPRRAPQTVSIITSSAASSTV
jgi:hypothetical protein